MQKKMKKQLKCVAQAASFFVGATALGPQAFAAERVNLQGVDPAVVQSMAGVAAHAAGVGVSQPSLQQVLALDPGNSFQMLRKNNDPTGKTHTRYEQKFHGIPVYGEQVIVHGDAQGNAQSLTGVAVDGIENDISENDTTTQQVSSEAALQKAKNNVVRYLKAGNGVSPSFRNEKIKLVIYLDAQQIAHDAWYINYVAEADGAEPVRPYFILDADDGRILKTWNGMAHAGVGTGPGGNEKSGLIEYGSGGAPFLDVMQSSGTCTMQTADVRTVNMGGGTGSYSTAYSYFCPRNTYQPVNGAYAPLNDAHFFGTVTHNMYQSYVSNAPLGSPIILRAHYGIGYENAFWDGTYTTFGDGADFFYPMSTSLNVVAHEVSHGNVEQNSGLEYVGQSGGINEAYADIAGETAEYFVNGQVDWLVGADVMKGKTKALRYFEDPRKDKRSIRHAADYYDGLDVHYSSGVFNRAFYLLANTPGWTVDKAFKVFYFANVNYWTPLSDYVDAACGVISATGDLAYNTAEVNTAFQTVGVNCPAPLVDVDGDHMDDNWETSHGLTVGVNDSADDADGDGLSNLQEFFANTNPQVADTDNDGVSDLYDPLPTDGDWLNFISHSAMFVKDDAKGAQTGFSVAAGDFDNDGFADTIIGAPYYDYRYGKSRYPDIGLVVVVSGKDGKALWFNIGDAKGQLYGWAVGNAGDVDNDSADDFIVGAPGTAFSYTEYRYLKKAGRVAVYNLSDVDSNGTPYAISEFIGYTNDRLGLSVAGLGNAGAGASNDVAVGIPGYDKNRGAVYVWEPATNNEVGFYSGATKSDNFGAAIAGTGDMTGEGFGDLAIGAPLSDYDGKKDAGTVYIATPSNGSYHSQMVTGSVAGGHLGASVAGGGDINGDGKPDFVVGAPFANKKAGAMSVWYGTDSSATLAAGFSRSGAASGNLMGASLAVVKDLNSDGKDEILVGSPGANKATGLVQLLSGTDGSELWSQTGKATKDNFGSSVASGDVNNDGKADFIIGARMSSAVGGTTGKPKVMKAAGSVSVINGEAATF